jgi:hypothetical protein
MARLDDIPAGRAQLRFFMGCLVGEAISRDDFRGPHRTSRMERYLLGALYVVSQRHFRLGLSGPPEDPGFVDVRLPKAEDASSKWPLERIAYVIVLPRVKTRSGAVFKVCFAGRARALGLHLKTS